MINGDKPKKKKMKLTPKVGGRVCVCRGGGGHEEVRFI